MIQPKSNQDYSLIEDLEIMSELGNLVATYGTQAFNYLIKEAATNRHSPFFKALVENCYKLIIAYENYNGNPEWNGEYFILQTLANFWHQLPQVCLFDVGANQGNWSLKANNIVSNAIIHCFEIAPNIFIKLKKNSQLFPNIITNEFGLSEAQGEIPIHYFPQADVLTTITEYHQEYKFESITTTGHVRKGDDYIKQYNIDHVHFLKIDVEGAEPLVLKGLLKTFEQKKIDVVQFEYGNINILTHYLLFDFYQFFVAKGYVIGKIFPNYVDFKKYAYGDENFLGPNYLAVKEDKVDFIKALSHQG